MSYRHIFGDPAKKKGQYTGIKGALCSGEGNYIKANGKYFAYGKTTGGAPVYIRKLSDVGRQNANAEYISTHQGRLTDFDFHPFIETLIATASEDCKVNINKFPSEGITERITNPEISIAGHKKKISLIKFHPSANNIIASASFDQTVKIFNVENGACIGTMSDCQQNIYSMDWNKDGSMLAVTAKDKTMRVYDPRQQNAVLAIPVFDGLKASKCFWADSVGMVGATGFSSGASRQMKLWDLRGDVQKPIYNQNIDDGSSVLMPHMDNDLSMLYLAGKGDSTLSYYELKNDDKIVYYLSSFRDKVAQKGGGWVPKRGLAQMKCEVQKFLKLTNDAVVPISFIVPRKSGGDVFQDDLYPECASTRPALSADQWASGNNAMPRMMSMDPTQRNNGGNNRPRMSRQSSRASQERPRVISRQSSRGVREKPRMSRQSSRGSGYSGSQDSARPRMSRQSSRGSKNRPRISRQSSLEKRANNGRSVQFATDSKATRAELEVEKMKLNQIKQKMAGLQAEAKKTQQSIARLNAQLAEDKAREQQRKQEMVSATANQDFGSQSAVMRALQQQMKMANGGSRASGGPGGTSPQVAMGGLLSFIGSMGVNSTQRAMIKKVVKTNQDSFIALWSFLEQSSKTDAQKKHEIVAEYNDILRAQRGQ